MFPIPAKKPENKPHLDNLNSFFDENKKSRLSRDAVKYIIILLYIGLFDEENFENNSQKAAVITDIIA
ncbi:MAG: hypothetical protein AABX38_01485 [Candidatus Micrarchaeota archaeon]